MRLLWTAAGLLMVGCAFVVETGCRESSGGTSQHCEVNIGLGPPPCDCISWTWVLRPFPGDYGDLPALAPDWSVSPPLARVSAGERFQVVLSAVNKRPDSCNEGYGNGTVRSTAPSILAFESKGGNSYWSIFVAAGPGTASLEALDLRTPSGGSENVALTVCGEPDAPELSCPRRVPLMVQVVP